MGLSIVTSMYNKRMEVFDTIDSLFFPSVLQNASQDKELVIMDDGSPLERETRELVAKHLPDLKSKFGNVIFQRNPANYGFGKSFNRGIRLANGDNLLVVNDDVYFPLGSIDSLERTLLEDSAYGLVAPLSPEKGEWTYQYCKQAPKMGAYSAEELEKIESFSRKLKELMAGKRITGELITAFCFATRASLIDELDAFDETYVHGTYEDTDLVRRVMKQGYEVVINPEIFVYHGGLKGTSSSLMQDPLKAAYYMFRNMGLHAKRWGYLETLKHVARGNYRKLTGRMTISDDIIKALKEQNAAL